MDGHRKMVVLNSANRMLLALALDTSLGMRLTRNLVSRLNEQGEKATRLHVATYPNAL